MSLRGSWTLHQHVLLLIGWAVRAPWSSLLLLFLLSIPCPLLLRRLCLLNHKRKD